MDLTLVATPLLQSSLRTQDKCPHSPTESPAAILRLEPPTRLKKHTTRDLLHELLYINTTVITVLRVARALSKPIIQLSAPRFVFLDRNACFRHFKTFFQSYLRNNNKINIFLDTENTV